MLSKYGTTIKKIRLEKKMYQKEIYSDIISRTFYYEFEKGNYDISSNKLIEILKNLNLTVDEFLVIHNNYNYDPYSDLFMKLMSSFHNDFEELKKIYIEYYPSNDMNKKVIAAISYGIYYINKKKLSPQDDTIIFLTNHFLSMNHWTISDITLFQYAMPIFLNQLSDLENLINQIFKDIFLYFKSNYQKEKIESIISEIYFNYIQLLLVNKKFEKAKQFKFFIQKNFYAISGVEPLLNIKCCNLIIDFFDPMLFSKSTKEYNNIIFELNKWINTDMNLSIAGKKFKRLAEKHHEINNIRSVKNFK